MESSIPEPVQVRLRAAYGDQDKYLMGYAVIESHMSMLRAHLPEGWDAGLIDPEIGSPAVYRDGVVSVEHSIVQPMDGRASPARTVLLFRKQVLPAVVLDNEVLRAELEYETFVGAFKDQEMLAAYIRRTVSAAADKNPAEAQKFKFRSVVVDVMGVTTP